MLPVTLAEALPIVIEYQCLIAGRGAYTPGNIMPIFPHSHAQLCAAIDIVIAHCQAAAALN